MKPIFLAISFFLMFAAVCCGPAAPANAQSLRMNQTVPMGITLPELRADDATGKINFSERKGKNLVLFFVSEQCGVTFYYKARLQKLIRDFGNRGFVFVGVRCGKKLHPEMPVELAEAKYLKIPFADDIEGKMAARFEIHQSLTFAVLDKAGRLCYQGGFDDNVDEGQVRKTPLRNALRDLASGRPVAVQGGRSLGCAIVPITP